MTDPATTFIAFLVLVVLPLAAFIFLGGDDE
jgi:hypothetical protein